jgi:pilus assembly protein Flp/PilA
MWDLWSQSVIRFLREEDGPTAVEYAVMLALIIVVCAVAVSAITEPTNQAFKNQDLRDALTVGS